MVMRYTNNMTDNSPGLPGNWKQMTSEQKRQYRLDRFQSTEGIDFVSPEAKKAYEARLRKKFEHDKKRMEEIETLGMGSSPMAILRSLVRIDDDEK